MKVRHPFVAAPVFLCIAALSGLLVLPSTGNTPGKLQVDGRERTYEVHVPANYDGSRAVPLVLALHGRLGTGAGQARLTHMNKTSDQHGFIVVYPDGLDRSWADGRGGTPSDKNGVDDVKFLSMLIDRLERAYKVDAARIYATGMSNGGFMSGRLACELSDRITAVAIVAASFSEALARSCRPQRPVSVLIMQGTKDPLVPFEGGALGKNGDRGQVLSHETAVQRWAVLDSCKETEHIDQGAVDDGSVAHFAPVTLHTGCRGAAEVADYVIFNGGHTWPGGRQYLPETLIGKTARDWDASEIIWEFFAAHPSSPAIK